MKKLLRLRTMLLLCALVAGSGSAWAESKTFSVDFESAGSTYTNWSFENLTFPTTVSGITAKGGEKFAETTGQTTAYAQTANKIATPTSLVCYYTKSSTNTNTSSLFKIQVSSDGESWTDVASGKTMNNVTKGTWEELSADLSEYSNVYVRVYYTGTTAKRDLDEITLIYDDGYTPDPTAPSATMSESSIDFGEVIFGQTKSMTFTVTPANLTSDLTIACNNDKYEVTPTSIAQSTTDETTITVTAKPTTKDDDMDGTITISGGGLASNKTVTLATTVVVREAVQPVGGAGSGYTLVTDASTLADGDVIILVNEDYGKAISAQSGNYRSVVDVTITDHAITSVPATVATLTLEGSEDAWYFHASDGYLYASSKSSNNMGTEADKDDNAKATISIDEDGKATIEFQGSNTRNNIRYNDNSGSNQRFSCYASTSSVSDMPMIYRQNVATSFDITIGDAKWRTMVSSKNVTLPAGLTAYIVTASSASSATLTAVSKVKANTAVLLNGNAGDYTLTVTEDDVTYDDTNLLQVSTETTGNGVYVLADKDGVGFYKWTGGSLGAGRVYLPAPAAEAREFLSFDFEETTGINNVESSKLDVEGFYNLAGQRVAQPTKGLYIVNGKKVIIK